MLAAFEVLNKGLVFDVGDWKTTRFRYDVWLEGRGRWVWRLWRSTCRMGRWNCCSWLFLEVAWMDAQWRLAAYGEFSSIGAHDLLEGDTCGGNPLQSGGR